MTFKKVGILLLIVMVMISSFSLVTQAVAGKVDLVLSTDATSYAPGATITITGSIAGDFASTTGPAGQYGARDLTFWFGVPNTWTTLDANADNLLDTAEFANGVINLSLRTPRIEKSSYVGTGTKLYKFVVPNASDSSRSPLSDQGAVGKLFSVQFTAPATVGTFSNLAFVLQGSAISKTSLAKYSAATGTSVSTVTLTATNATFNAASTVTVEEAVTSHTVTFVDYDETTVLKAAQTVEDGADAIPPVDNPTRDGYKFTGWSPAYTNITADTTCVAQYRLPYVPEVDTPVIGASDTSVSLPTQDNSASHRAITWTSTSTWISDKGDIINPPHGAGAQQVTLTASITDEDSTDVIVTVPEKAASQALAFTRQTTDVTLSGVSDVASDSAGNFYVADSNNNRVVKFNSEGVAQAVYGVGMFNLPMGLAVDELNNIYVADTYNNRVVMFTDDNNDGDIDEGEFTAWGELGGNDLQFKKPQGLAAKDGKVYVADTANNRVVSFSNVENPVDWTEIAIGGTGDGDVKVPNDVAVDGNDNIWVSDSLNKRVQMFKSDLTFRISYNTADDDILPENAYPFGLAVDASGNVFAAIRQAGVVKCVNNTDADNVAKYNGQSKDINPFINPVGIVIKDNKVFVCDVTGGKISLAPLAP